MKIVFISGVKFGYEILNEILENDWTISALFTYKSDKKKFYSDFADFEPLSKKYSFLHKKVDNINDKENIDILKKIKPDLILVMGWSQLLKHKIIKIPTIGVIGSHPTELPKYRGRAPIPWTILKNLKQSAETFFWIEEGVDDGDILDQTVFSISDDEDANSLYFKVINVAKQMLLKNLKLIQQGTINRKKQDSSKHIEIWKKRTPDDGKIDWTESVKNISTLIRASTDPYPGAFCNYKTNILRIWKSKIISDQNDDAGKILEIIDDGVKVGTGNGVILLQKVSINNDQKIKANRLFLKEDVGSYLS